MKERLRSFFKHETVFCVAALLALLSMFLVPPSGQYLSYLNGSILALLFCLMAVVEGFRRSGLFRLVSAELLRHVKSSRRLAALLVLLCFFFSMFITNDVALITFVPFTLGLLAEDREEHLIFVITLETMAANLGSMVTPIGNPQNLFLYTYYQMDIGEFFALLLPPALLSLGLLMLCVLCSREEALRVETEEPLPELEKPSLIKFGVLFLLCVLTVLRLLPWQGLLIVLLAVLLLTDRGILARVDYFLLLTFVAFFVLVGNLEQLPQLRAWLSEAMAGRTLWLSALLSQFISNVPSAVMLAPFTRDAQGLLLGVDLGGLGTLVASLASLISFKFYTAHKGAKPGRYLLCFSLWNFAFLALLLAFEALIR